MRAADGTVYGPVDLQALKEWGLQGRIEPEDEISSDGQNWIPAESLPDLEMDWLVRLEDGALYGPFNLALLPGLVANGDIPESAALEHRHTGETCPLAAALPDEREEADASPSTHADPLPEASDEKTQTPEEEDVLPFSRRLEPLQRSASEARGQMLETRKALQALRSEYAVLQDETKRLSDELGAAVQSRRKSEQDLLEQQDRAAQAEADIDNLKAQLEQIKDHYDRLQLENQNQFEQIDNLQAAQIAQEQHFKRDLADWRARSDAKTARLAEVMQVLMQDEDLADRLPVHSTVPILDNSVELQSTVQRLQQQIERERDQAGRQMRQLRLRRRRPPVIMLLLISALTLAVIMLIWKPRTSRRQAEGVRIGRTRQATTAADGEAGSDAALPRTTGAALDLSPDTGGRTDATAGDGAAVMAMPSWPAINLPRATITRSDRALRIVFEYGLFSTAARLSPDAITDLAALAVQIRNHLNGYQLMIEGHTDATPIVSGTSRYVDNFALGMARAEAVKTFFTAQGKLPAEAIRTASAGESSPLFPNDTETGRMRNRTVVLTLLAR